jgi:hypothetical protein
MATTTRTSSLPRQDTKKVAVLGALILVLAGLWGKMALGGKAAPKTAAAMTAPQPTSPTASNAADNKSRAADALGLLRDWVGEPLPQAVSRNIFEVKIDYYPIDSTHQAKDSGTVNDPTFWENLAKSIDAQADQQHKRENLIQNLRQQAGQLSVTSTLMGARPRAMINGVMVGEGEVVAQFRVAEIRARSVVVEREGIKLDIPMK